MFLSDIYKQGPLTLCNILSQCA